ncbi:MAG: phospholipase D-like domain-containing protein [Chthoniobacterales bacterium]
MNSPIRPNHLASWLLLAAGWMAMNFLSGCAITNSFSESKKIRESIQPLDSAASPSFRQAIGSLLSGSFVPGNNIVTLVNGDQIFPAMLGGIRSAKQTINFETYVFWDSPIAKQISEALAERASAGVKVNVILDAQGTNKMGSENLSRMRNAGVQVEKYHSLFWWDIRRFNNRTHRKLLIVDGKTAFIGGVGIASEWMGNAESPEHWRDNHYQITGPVVAQIQGIFMDNWLKTRGSVLHGPEYFPPLSPTGPYLAQAFKSSPRQGDIDLHLLYLLSITSAQKTLRIENAFFLPDDKTRAALIAAAGRGVKVEVVSPGKHIDQKLVRISSKRHWATMLRAGIKLYEYQPTMLHVKLMIVDDIFVSVGSGNFDNRSIRLNDEANLNVVDRGFAAQQTKLFEMDKRRSREITLDKAGELTFTAPLEQALSLSSPQL